MGSWSLVGNKLGAPPQGVLGTSDNNALVIETNGTERLRVDTNGNVGIGTTDPSHPLHIAAGKVLRIEGGINANDAADYFSFGGNGSFGIDAPGVVNGRFIVQNSGNVGIGTTTPTSTLHVNGSVAVTGRGLLTVSGEYNNPQGITNFNYNVNVGYGAANSVLAVSASAPGSLGPIISITNTGGGQNSACALDFYTFDPGEGAGPDHAISPSSRIQAVDDGNFTNDIVFLINTPGAANNKLVEKLRITSTGSLNVPGDVVLTGADCAEHFNVAGETPEPGTVVVIDTEGALKESRVAYDKKVAGVVSGAGDYRPGLVLDMRPSEEERIPVALAGKVYCKVDARYSPVEIGDLLTTSHIPGHAMKAVEPLKAFGSVIGKALKPLRDGKGLIPILVALQ